MSLIALGSFALVGLLVSGPDMRRTAEEYFSTYNIADITIIGDLGIDETNMEAIDQVQGAEAIEYGYLKDVIIKDTSTSVRVFSSTPTLSQYEIVEGRMPQSSDEVAIASFLDGSIGDTITFDEESEDEVLKKHTFTIVGKVNSTELLSSINMGQSSAGDGQLKAYAVVDEDAFDSDVYMLARISFEDTEGVDPYSDEYTDLIQAHKEELNTLLRDQPSLRLETIRSEYQEQIDDGQEEIDDAKQELADAKKELEDARDELDQGYVDVQDAKDELNEKVTSAQSEIDENTKTLNNSTSSLQESEKELADAKVQLDEAAQTIADKEKEIADAKTQLDEASATLASSKQQLDDAKTQLDSNKALLDEAAVQLEETKTTLDQADTVLTERRSQLDASQSQLQASRTQLDESWNALFTKVLGSNWSSIYTKEKAIALLSQEQSQEVQASLNTLNQSEAEYSAASELLAQKEAEYEAKLEEYNAGLQQYTSAKTEYDTNVSLYNQKLSEYEQGKQTYEAGLSEYNANMSVYQDGVSQLASGKSEYASKTAEYNDAAQQIKDGWAEVEDAAAKISDAQSTLNQEKADAEKQIRDAEDTLEEGEQEYSDKLAEYNDKEPDALKDIQEAEDELADAQNTLENLETPTYALDTRREIPGSQGYKIYSTISNIVDSLGRVFPIFLYFVAALVTLTTMTRFVDEERINSGTLKALGYEDSDVIKKFVIYGFTASISGAVIGIIAGHILIPNIVYNAYGENFTYPHVKLYFYPGITCIALILAMLSSVLPAYLVAKRELKENPASLLLPKAPAAGNKILLEHITPLWSRLSFTHKVTCRNIFRYKKRMAMTIFGVCGSVTLLFAGFSVQHSIEGINERQFGEILKYDMIVAKNNYLTSEETEELDTLLSDDSVDSNMPIVYEECSKVIGSNQDEETIELIIPDDEDLFSQYVSLTNRKTNEELVLGSDGIIISEKLADLLDLEQGDTFTFNDSDDIEHTVKIAGICEMYTGHFMFMSSSYYEEIFGSDYKTNAYLLKLVDSSLDNTSEISSKFIALGGVKGVVQNTTMINMINTIVDALNQIMDVLITVATLLAIVILYNLTNINVSERIRELSTIKVLGFFDSEVTMYIYRETILLTAAGILVGFLGGDALYLYILAVVPPDEVMFSPALGVKGFMVPALLVTIITFLLGCYMNHKMKYVDMLEALKSVD